MSAASEEHNQIYNWVVSTIKYTVNLQQKAKSLRLLKRFYMYKRIYCISRSRSLFVWSRFWMFVFCLFRGNDGRRTGADRTMGEGTTSVNSLRIQLHSSILRYRMKRRVTEKMTWHHTNCWAVTLCCCAVTALTDSAVCWQLNQNLIQTVEQVFHYSTVYP